jgi:hypothetical protein
VAGSQGPTQGVTSPVRPVPFRVSALLWLALASSCTLAGADESRDLSRYEVAGPYLIQDARPDADRLSGQLREFLWTHWLAAPLSQPISSWRVVLGRLISWSRISTGAG